MACNLTHALVLHQSDPVSQRLSNPDELASVCMTVSIQSLYFKEPLQLSNCVSVCLHVSVFIQMTNMNIKHIRNIPVHLYKLEGLHTDS